MVVALYRDIALCYGVSSKLQKVEIQKIEFRFSREGISFLTKCFPRFGKAVDTALSKGTALSVVGLTKSPNSVIPKLFGWLLSKVFNSSGFELDQPDPIALKHFRQLVYLLYKLEMPYEDKETEKVINAFIQTEEDLGQVPEAEFSSDWISQARDFVTRAVCSLDPQRITPKHGPGSVATGECVLEKSNFKRIYSSIEAVYPFMGWYRFNASHIAASYVEDQRDLKEIPTPLAKVVLVPKDSRGPRLISCEPLEVQWIQQGLGVAFQQHLEASHWTRGHVNFTCQLTNRRLALEGSRTGRWVTLDMKEASDRVSTELVKRLFNGHPLLLEALLATRSSHTVLPDGRIIEMKKFAPMGSSLCFPVESLVFYALAVSAIKQTGKSWREARKCVYVYGDDLIVDREVYPVLLQLFPRVGLMFNDGKCCVARSFRESCGCDAYEGIDITPVKIKTIWSHRRTNDPKCLMSYVALYNAMYGLGHFQLAEYVQSLLTERYGEIPYTNRYEVAGNGSYVSTSHGAAYVCHEPAKQKNSPKIWKRFNRHLHVLEFSTYESVPKKVKTKYDGYSEWLRRLSTQYGSFGGVYALVRRNRLKRTWARV